MTNEEVEGKFQEHVEILKSLENLIVTQEATFVVHNDRLQLLRKLYVAITDLKELQSAAVEQRVPEELPKTSRKTKVPK